MLNVKENAQTTFSQKHYAAVHCCTVLSTDVSTSRFNYRSLIMIFITSTAAMASSAFQHRISSHAPCMGVLGMRFTNTDYNSAQAKFWGQRPSYQLFWPAPNNFQQAYITLLFITLIPRVSWMWEFFHFWPTITGQALERLTLSSPNPVPSLGGALL